MPPALVERLPPIWQLPSAARLRGKRRPTSRAAACTSASTQPASTVMVWSTGSRSRTRFMRDRERTTSSPPGRGMPPATMLVLPPWGTTAVLVSAQIATIAATSAVLPGCSTSGVTPR